MGSFVSNAIGIIATLFIGLTTVATVNTAVGNMGNDQAKLTIDSKDILNAKVKEQFTMDGWKEKMKDSNGRYDFFLILKSPADTLGNAIGLGINYLINKP